MSIKIIFFLENAQNYEKIFTNKVKKKFIIKKYKNFL